MQVQSVRTGYEAFGLFDVHAHLIDVPRAAGIIARSGYAATERPLKALKTDDVIGLPAVQAEMEILHLGYHFLRVNTNLGITLFGYSVCLCNQFFFHLSGF